MKLDVEVGARHLMAVPRVDLLMSTSPSPKCLGKVDDLGIQTRTGLI